MTLEKSKLIIKKIIFNRKYILIGLLLALISMGFFYASNYQQHLENPNTSIILKSYPLGETVAVTGVVTEVNNNSFIIRDNYHGINVNYTIYSTEKVSTS